ncbi:MAG: hypothetical protein MI861_11640, partial [Pirellulales bacterium]|nr:hypothetical protein [Pirellulales bacterium]
MPAASAVDVFVSAAVGQPYGVASIEIPVDPPVVGRNLPPVMVTEATGRVLFPIADDIRVRVAPPSQRPVPPPGRGRLLNRVGNLIRELTDKDQDLQQTVARRVTFLTRGSEPLRVQLSDARGVIGEYEIVPENREAERGQLMDQWWTSYTEAARRQMEAAKYPTRVESYLVAMLSGRLRLPLPAWYINPLEEDDELLGTLKLIAGAGEMADTVFRRAAAGDTQLSQSANLPLPPPP